VKPIFCQAGYVYCRGEKKRPRRKPKITQRGESVCAKSSMGLVEVDPGKQYTAKKRGGRNQGVKAWRPRHEREFSLPPAGSDAQKHHLCERRKDTSQLSRFPSVIGNIEGRTKRGRVASFPTGVADAGASEGPMRTSLQL